MSANWRTLISALTAGAVVGMLQHFGVSVPAIERADVATTQATSNALTQHSCCELAHVQKTELSLFRSLLDQCRSD